jgi:amidophosphoribosyltransferase
VYQDLDDLKAAVRKANPAVRYFEASCFDGDYITGDITLEYLNTIESAREAGKAEKGDKISQLDLDLENSEV